MERTIEYTPSGICARKIKVALSEDGTIKDIEFTGGCDGNHKGVIALCRGRRPEEVVSLLDGITCGSKKSSCPDQLAQALKEVL